MIAIRKSYIRKGFRIQDSGFSVLLAVVLAFILCSPLHAEEDTETNLPVPRFVSLRSNEVNMRVGPGTRYSITWVYHRADWPVEIIQEFDQWREIRDVDGTTGWVHKQALQSKRAVLTRNGVAVMRHSPDLQGRPLLRIEPKVAGVLLGCEKNWCRVQIAGHKGWLEKAHLWGIYPREEF